MMKYFYILITVLFIGCTFNRQTIIDTKANEVEAKGWGFLGAWRGSYNATTAIKILHR